MIPGNLPMTKAEQAQWQPIKFVMNKDSTGTRLNGVEVKHIPNAQEIISELNNSGG